MRAMPPAALIGFHLCGATAAAAGVAIGWGVYAGTGRVGVSVGCAGVAAWIGLVGLCRLAARPERIADGPIREGSTDDRRWGLHLLALLFAVNPIIKSRLLPVPILGWVYRLAGARWGKQTYCNGVVLDPPHVTLGDRVMLGEACVVYAHVIEGEKLELRRVWIGDGVTVGAGAIVMPGCRIGDNATIAAGSVLKKDTRVEAGEVWGGVPAQRLRGPQQSQPSDAAEDPRRRAA